MKHALFVAWLVIAALGTGACGNTTGGDLIHIPFQAGGLDRPGNGSLTFTSATGWAITLDEARIALGPFYFNVSAASTSSFRTGVVIMEVTQQIVVDPLDPALQDVSAGADGQTGDSVSVEIGLLPPDGTESSADGTLLGTHQGYVRGVAVRGTTQVPFQGFITLDASLVTATAPLEAVQRIPGAVARLVFVKNPQRLVLRVDPTAWFDSVTFTPLLSGTAVDGNYSWTSPSSFLTTLLSGVTQEAGVYDFSLVPLDGDAGQG